MTLQRAAISINAQTLSSYDPLAWRKDVNVMAKNFPDHIVINSYKAENSEKIVENMFWKSIYLRTRP